MKHARPESLPSAQPAPWPCYSEEEIDAVARVLRSNRVNYWTGDEGRRFEEGFAALCDVPHAIALANGTVALDLILHGLEIGSANGGAADDEVVVTPRSFIASASAVVNAGAVPVFADVDPDSQTITPETVSEVLTPRTRAILCIHLAGWPCDMDGFKALVDRQDIRLIEDCAQAHGALYRGRPVGGLGDAAAWSFCQDKIMTTGGEGGMVTCRSRPLWERMWSFKDHGKSWNAVHSEAHPPGYRWVHHSIGTNWRMTEMQAAIGNLQLARLPEWAAARRDNAARLHAAFAPFSDPEGPLRVPDIARWSCADGSRHAYYRFYAFVRPEGLCRGQSRDDLVAELSAQGLLCQHGVCPEIYRERAFGDRVTPRLPVARALGETSIMVAVHPGLEMPPVSLTRLT